MNEERLSILLVDDDEDDYILTSDLLDQVNGTAYDVEWASSYENALISISQNHYDICLFDYHLGERTGLDLLEEAIASGCKSPIILLTGQGDNGIDTQAIQTGASDYLSKSEINSDMLERSLRYAMERKRTEERIVHMAFYDTLTKLPNRSLFHDRLTKALAYTNRYGGTCALMFLDLDNFKRINDTLEHRIGDLLLQGVADRLNKIVRSSDTVARPEVSAIGNTIARFGGDEFTILLTEVRTLEGAARVAQRLLEILSQPFNLDGHEVFVSASIGIAIAPTDGEDKDTLIKNADTAMYHAKEHGKNSFQFYKNAMTITVMDRLNMENDLRKAVERGEFQLHYQPKIDISTGIVMGTEALIRWEHPEKGLISPADFIPLAEETGFIIAIGEWVLKTACKQNMFWQKQGSVCPSIRVAINLSGHQFRQDNLIKIIEKELVDSALDPRFLELEITESIMMQNADSTIAALHKLKDMGVQLSMDDFGTGYSSFNYLKRFPLDSIKIDRSFIQDITNNKRDATIVKAIIVMAQTLDMKVVAEGVETNEQLQLLQEFGCDEMQGFLLCRPLPPGHVYEFLEIWENVIKRSSL